MAGKRKENDMVGYILPVLPLAIAYLFFPYNMGYVAASILLLVPLYSFLGWDGRINLAYGILLMLAAAVLLGYREMLANHMLQYGFWLILAGVLCQIIDFIRNKKSA